MKKLKNYHDIKAWLNEHNIQNYKIKPDLQFSYHVDVEQSIDLSHKNLTDIPIKFGHVTNLIVKNNRLTNLSFAPYEASLLFDCSYNALTNLNEAPQKVANFNCSNNMIKSLYGCPLELEDFNCSHNELKTLEGGPQKVEYSYNCGQNHLMSLKGSPNKTRGFNCSDNELLTLEYCPQEIEYFFYARRNKLITLDFLPNEVGNQFSISGNEQLLHYENFNFLQLKEILKIEKEKMLLEQTIELQNNSLEKFKAKL